jgi:hypothetical protein
MTRGDPVDGPLHFPAIGRIPTPRRRIVSASEFNDLPARVLDRVRARDEVAIAKAHFRPGQAKTSSVVLQIVG